MSALVPLNLPRFDIRVRRDDDSRRGGLEVFDQLRGRWVALTPEEWVRQHFVNFLITQRGFPRMLMANEVSLTFNSMARRADTMVYTRALKPLCIVEYKAPDVAVTQKVFDQIARYNSVIEAPCLIVSNGLHHYCCRYTPEGYTFLPDIPHYSELLY
ncbi:MAG: type I restriction enzyme HsdR N-terminal domain-containing protein [Muribaculaceae bacterium]|nr:type I restriction enzyme HsdR N-terminal domain-containing protein [Muribaculaceae bacterium]